MAFGIGTNSSNTFPGSVRGKQKQIACECWFTSTGKLMPLMLKVKDENGEIQVIREITVHSQEKKMYAGIPSIEFDCTLNFANKSMRVWMIYYQTENRWVLNFR